MKKRNKNTRRVRKGGFLGRFRRNERGTTAVEFAFVGIPFLAFLFMTIEVAFVYGGTVSLEYALEKSARKIRVGQAFPSLQAFRNDVCSHVIMMHDCNSNLVVDVRTLGGFQDVSNTDVLSDYTDEDGNFEGQNPDDPGQYSPGQGGSVVLVNIFYKWDIIAQLPLFYRYGEGGSPVSPLANQGDGSRIMTATTAFQNEPF